MDDYSDDKMSKLIDVLKKYNEIKVMKKTFLQACLNICRKWFSYL